MVGAPFPGLAVLRRGRSPNCSSGGMVVGLALVSVIAAGALLNAWAGRFLRWRDRGAGSGGEGGPDAGSEPPRLRDEDDGAILEWGDPRALLYLDRARAAEARAAGAVMVGGGPSVEGALRAPTEVHVAITDRCDAGCRTCYREGRAPADPSREDLAAVFQKLAAMGVFEVPLGGGEVMLRDDLVAIAAAARAAGLTPNITTSGRGLTPDRARALRGIVGQVNVSVDGPEAVCDAVRGRGMWAEAVAALDVLRDVGVPAGANTVLTRPLLGAPDALEVLARDLVDRGVIDWQWLRLKPAGRGAATYDTLVPTGEQASAIWPRALAIEAAEGGPEVRFDCAMVPFLAEHAPPVDLLHRLGITGCPGGHSLWSRSVEGRWSPCSFAADHGGGDWASDEVLAEWRRLAARLPAPCASCEYASVCRGGCRIVARHRGALTDPECPRVIRLEAHP